MIWGLCNLAGWLNIKYTRLLSFALGTPGRSREDRDDHGLHPLEPLARNGWIEE